MIAVMLVVGLLCLQLLSIGDIPGASVLGFLLVILGWAQWRAKNETLTAGMDHQDEKNTKANPSPSEKHVH